MPHGHLVFWQDSVAEYCVLFDAPFPTLTCWVPFKAWAGQSRNPRERVAPERLQRPKKADLRCPVHVEIHPWELLCLRHSVFQHPVDTESDCNRDVLWVQMPLKKCV